ncbi:MAG: MFS transporter [Magnetococcales bacterium]|nr:MFS transporter [Magnetococcales bacterium]
MSLPLSSRHETFFLFTLAGIQFTHILDFMIMMPLGPLLIEAFGIDTQAFGLLVASYTLSAGTASLLVATFIDRFERKKLLLVVFFLFGASTLACGLAASYPALLVARGLSGTFGGVMGAMVQTMIGDVIPYSRRARASGLVAAAFSVSTVAGVPVSLWLANHLQWRTPFLLTAALTGIVMLPALRTLPELRQHIHHKKPAHAFSTMFMVLSDFNHIKTLIYSTLIIFSGFTVIPYITLYAVHNVGIAQFDIPIVYLVGGTATLFSSQLIGRWADRRGKVEVYRRLALATTIPLLVVTHVSSATLPIWILCTTTFFVLVSGRMIPAITIITAAAQPGLRGTFMSLNATAQSLAMGAATLLTGFVVGQESGGQIVGYAQVGYIAVLSNLMAIWFVGHITIHDQHRS